MFSWFDSRIYRRAFRSRLGWGAPMALVVLVLLGLVTAVEPQFRGLAKWTVEWWGFLGLLGVVATAGASFRSLHALARLGVRGWRRPRWWFEFGSIGCNIFAGALLLIALVGLSLAVGLAGRWQDAAWWLGKRLVRVALVWFSVAALVGMGLAALQHRRCRGNAFECVQFFLVTIGGVTLATIGGVNWPPARLWPDGVLTVACGGIGLVILLWGMFAIFVRMAAQKEFR